MASRRSRLGDRLWRVDEGGQVFALDNRGPHMGFPLERGSVGDGILTCHRHHARFELASGCTFDLWAEMYRLVRSRFARRRDLGKASIRLRRSG